MKQHIDKTNMSETQQDPAAPNVPVLRKVVVVVTQKFFGDDEKPTAIALANVIRLGVADCIFQYDRKDLRGRANAEAALGLMESQLEEAGVRVTLQQVDVISTARRWYYGLVKAFNELNAVAALLFPGDLEKPLNDVQVDLLKGMLAHAEADGLHPADYSTDDAFKEHFDKLVTLPAIDLLFSAQAPAVRALGLSKLRTEIVLVGRNVLRVFERSPVEAWGADPIPPLILTVLHNPPLRVKTPVHLGKLGDDEERRHPVAQFNQIARLIMQLFLDRVAQEGATAKQAKDQLAASERLGVLADSTFVVMQRALNNNLRRLGQSAEVSPVVLVQTKVLASLRNRAMYRPNVSCVAFYGTERRPAAFAECLGFVQKRLRDLLLRYFENGWIQVMPAKQAHATLLGLEAVEGVTPPVNENWSRQAKCSEPMDLAELAAHLREFPSPMRIQFGGFHQPDAPEVYGNAFKINEDGLFVLKGWPVAQGQICDALWKFREAAEKSRTQHKWGKDNDAFLVVAQLTEKPWQAGNERERAEFLTDLARAQHQIRFELAGQRFEFDLMHKHCCVVRYESADLCMTRNTRSVALDDLTERSLAALYQDPSLPWPPPPNVPLSKGPYRAAYALPEGIPLARRLEKLYAGQIGPDDSLYKLLKPVDQRGEVQAWGGPHLTVLDALTMRDVEDFESRIRAICQSAAKPLVTPLKVSVWGANLVITCESAGLQKVRADLIAATRHCVERYSLTDEEVQHARRWIQESWHEPERQLMVLDEALRRYTEAGAPALPSSRHFRMNYLVRLTRTILRAKSADKTERTKADLHHFLTHGEPHWYASAGSFHLTIASGLTGGDDAKALARELEPSLLADFPPIRISRLAIMTEDSDTPVTVRFHDSSTDGFVGEVRPGFKVVGWADLELAANCPALEFKAES